MNRRTRHQHATKKTECRHMISRQLKPLIQKPIINKLIQHFKKQYQTMLNTTNTCKLATLLVAMSNVESPPRSRLSNVYLSINEAVSQLWKRNWVKAAGHWSDCDGGSTLSSTTLSDSCCDLVKNWILYRWFMEWLQINVSIPKV